MSILLFAAGFLTPDLVVDLDKILFGITWLLRHAFCLSDRNVFDKFATAQGDVNYLKFIKTVI